MSGRALPRFRSSFIGRDEELSAAVAALRDTIVPLVTIAGRSGVGKTRLAVEAARRVEADLPGGGVFIPASEAQTLGLVSAIAIAIGADLSAGPDATEILRRQLNAEPALILLDDADVVLDELAGLLELLDTCPGTRLLITAARPLRTPGEHVVRVHPFATLDEPQTEPSQAQTSAAVQLFAARAAAVDHRFRLTPNNAADIAAVCRRLDGLPLAIEIAAARVPTLSPAAQLAMLDEDASLDFSTQARSGIAAPPSTPHGNVRAALYWTLNLASDHAGTVLRRMGVFDGSASYAELRAITADATWSESTFIDALTELVDLSLVEPVASADGTERFTPLPLIRAFARGLSREANDWDALVDRHAVAYAQIGTTDGWPTARHIERLAREREELHVALDRMTTSGQTQRAATLAIDLAPLWLRDGYAQRARENFEPLAEMAADSADSSHSTLRTDTRVRVLYWWTRLTLARPDVATMAPVMGERIARARSLTQESGSPELRLLALGITVLFFWVTRDVAATVPAATEAFAIASATNDEPWLVMSESWMGMLAQQSGNLDRAIELGSHALARAQRLGEPALIVPPAMLVIGLARALPAPPADLPSLETILEQARAAGDRRSEGIVLSSLEWAHYQAGEEEAAVRTAIELLQLGRRGNTWVSGFGLLVLAAIAADRSADEVAARLLGFASPTRAMVETALTPEPAALIQEHIDRARDRAGAERFDQARDDAELVERGSAIEEAIDVAQRFLPTGERPAGSEPSADSAPIGHPTIPLTPRERDVLLAMASGKTNKEVATELGMRPKTVMHHAASVYEKLGVRSRAEATAWAYRNGLMETASTDPPTRPTHREGSTPVI